MSPSMPTSSQSQNLLAALSPAVTTYIEASNSCDLDRMLSVFAENALVNDQLRDYRGKAEIREWADRDIIGERLSMDVTRVIEHHGNLVVTANVDGNFDKRGLPNPLVLAFYFTLLDDQITQLIILRNRLDI
jgi:hypothetical protein